MRRLVFACLVMAAATPALARQASTSITCAAARALVERQGAVLFDTSPTTFDRYVRDRSFCAYGETIRPDWIPTRDTPSCNVGYRCQEPVPFGPFRY